MLLKRAFGFANRFRSYKTSLQEGVKTPYGAFFNARNVKLISVLLLLFFSVSLAAQKKLSKTIYAQHIDVVQVSAAYCFEVNLATHPGDDVLVDVEIEGEYTKDLELEIKTDGSTLFVEPKFNPSFENPNDKLSAHKVVSILLNISVPTGKDVAVFGSSVRVFAQGEYQELRILLSDGSCNLKHVFGEVEVKTQSGAINVSATKANIEASSKYGRVDPNPIPKGTSTYQLQTVTGNILLSKTE